jgi:hypothetical protein
MTEDTADPIERLRGLWSDARLQGITTIEINGRPVGPDPRDVLFFTLLDQLEAEHAEIILALEDLTSLQATTIGGVMEALGQAKAALNRVGDHKAAARIKLSALREVARNLEGVELKADDMMAIAVKSVVYRLKHQYAQEAGDE